MLAPTHLWLGALNIQAFASPLPLREAEQGEGFLFARRFMPILEQRVVLGHDHLFENAANFGTIAGRFVFVDYGDPEIQGLLRVHADALARDFPLV